MATILLKSSNLASLRVKQFDNMGLWWDAMGSTHHPHDCLAKMFNQNLLMRKQTNPESGTFFKTTCLDCPKCQQHREKNGSGRNVLDKNELET